MSNLFQSELGLKHNGDQTQQGDQEEQDVDCPDTKIIWEDGEEYEQLETDYLNQVFPYKLNSKNLSAGVKFHFHFLASSLYYWVQLVQELPQEQNKWGKKDCALIAKILKQENDQNWIAFSRWCQYFNRKEEYHLREDEEDKFEVPAGTKIHSYKRGEYQYELIAYAGSDQNFVPYKKRMEVLLLFYIDFVSFIKQQVDTWTFYLLYKVNPKTKKKTFAGMLSQYNFRLSSVRERHRVSQVFILPSLQNQGHGKEILDVVYKLSLDNPKCFEITTEVPSFEFQCLRDYKQSQLLLKANLINLEYFIPVSSQVQIEQNYTRLLSKQTVRAIKEKLKIPGHQIDRLVSILIYYKSGCQQLNSDMAIAHFEELIRKKVIVNKSPFKTRKRLPNITLFGQNAELKDFFVEKVKEDLLRDQKQVLEKVLQTIEGYKRVISKLRKVKLLP